MATKQSSRIQGLGFQTLAPGGSYSVNPRNLDNLMGQFTVSNEEAAGSGQVVYICGTDGTEAIPVYPQTVVSMETDAPFRIKFPKNKPDTNAGAGAANTGTATVCVGQLLLRGSGGASSAPGAPGAGSGSTAGGGGTGGTVGDTNNRFHFH